MPRKAHPQSQTRGTPHMPPMAVTKKNKKYNITAK
jgi:hypothetical protein